MDFDSGSVTDMLGDLGLVSASLWALLMAVLKKVRLTFSSETQLPGTRAVVLSLVASRPGT